MTFTVLRNSCTLYTFTVLRQNLRPSLLSYPHPMTAGVKISESNGKRGFLYGAASFLGRGNREDKA
jgi:hypothetical protein